MVFIDPMLDPGYAALVHSKANNSKNQAQTPEENGGLRPLAIIMNLFLIFLMHHLWRAVGCPAFSANAVAVELISELTAIRHDVTQTPASRISIN